MKTKATLLGILVLVVIMGVLGLILGLSLSTTPIKSTITKVVKNNLPPNAEFLELYTYRVGNHETQDIVNVRTIALVHYEGGECYLYQEYLFQIKTPRFGKPYWIGEEMPSARIIAKKVPAVRKQLVERLNDDERS